MAAVLGHPREIVFKCDECKTELPKPVEDSAVYVSRKGDLMLLCHDCVKEDDLYIWGDASFLDTGELEKQ